MGTLTAGCPRLDAHCPHKLATSCRLTSTPNCCACADERAHSRTYRVYIDGIGFVQRGTRWQGYCWFCKEFWTNRLAATDPPLELSQTRIPEVPDQSEFLERWFEFHQGYRIAKLQDGSEQHMPVIGEPFKEVSPGFLPRTLAQLSAGVENGARRPENRLRRRRLSSEVRPEGPQQSLESALDDLLAEASDDETPHPFEETATATIEAPAPAREAAPTGQQRPLNRGEARLQRARERFARVFGTREDIQQDDYESPLSTMFNGANARYRQAEERRATDDVYPPPFDGLSAQERREIEEQLLWGVMRESATHHEPDSEGDVWSYAPRTSQVETSGSVDAEPTPALSSSIIYANEIEAIEAIEASIRADMPALGLPTVPPTTTGPSQPLTSTASSIEFTREQIVLQERLNDYEHLNDYERLNRRAQLVESANRRSPLPDHQEPTPIAGPSQSTPGMSQIQTSIQQITSELERLRLASEAITSARHSMHSRFVHTERPIQTLDNQPSRPPPMSDEEMTKTLACQVCYQQLADTAVLPCGHMVMCQWCADVVIPVKHSHLPVRPSKCPMCRKVVKQRFRIHMGS